jgi:hypothetical protein
MLKVMVKVKKPGGLTGYAVKRYVQWANNLQ